MRFRLMLLTAATSAAAIVPAGAQRPGGAQRPTANAAERDERADTPPADSAPGVQVDQRVDTSERTITSDGMPIAFTARAGTMVLNDSLGKPAASVFYIAYTKDQEGVTGCPVTYFFNCGPGSASIWLDMGIMSPRHPDMGPGGQQPTPPYDLVDNPNLPLDVTYLVQVDAMMTGYSRPAPGVKVTDFTGDVNDITLFGEFI